MKTILVVGASGLIGSRFVELAKNKLNIIPVDENTVDITNKKAVLDFFDKSNFDSVVNFAAYTNVDGAEKERGNELGICYRLNVIGCENLAKACKLKNRFLVQISTDFVFTGTTRDPGPYGEDSLVPSNLVPSIGWYGWTKNQAELRMKNEELRNAIVRISYPFSVKDYDIKLDFARNYLKLYDEGKLFPIFSDQIITPILIEDLITPLSKILEDELQGVFHIVSRDTTTSSDFVEYLIKKVRNVEGVVQKGSMEEFLKVEGRTPRPRLGGLKTKITEQKLGIKFKTWKEMVDSFAENH